MGHGQLQLSVVQHLNIELPRNPAFQQADLNPPIWTAPSAPPKAEPFAKQGVTSWKINTGPVGPNWWCAIWRRKGSSRYSAFPGQDRQGI